MNLQGRTRMPNVEINKLALKNFYETRKEEYFKRRSSGNKKLWDEQYKWDILPALNQKLSSFNKITKENVTDFIAIVNDNSNKSNFAHWIDMDDLKLLADLPYGNQILDIVWQANSDNADEAIDTANNISSSFSPHKKFSPSTWGYILAAKNCDQFAIYRDFICKELIEINNPSKTKNLAQGEKYQLLNDSALYLGKLIQQDKASKEGAYKYTALNGQDFLWALINYKNGGNDEK